MNGLKQVRIWRNAVGGLVPEVIDAGPTPAPGLVVGYYRWGNNPSWCVFHEASGIGVADADSPEHALALATALGELADWTLPGADLQRVPGLDRAVFRTVHRLAGRFAGVRVDAETVTAGGAA